jgi:hypothetical protein
MPATVAESNLFHARAALMTARQRLHDAEDRFAQSLECSADFINLNASHNSLAWWQAQVQQAEKAVADLENELR